MRASSARLMHPTGWTEPLSPRQGGRSGSTSTGLMRRLRARLPRFVSRSDPAAQRTGAMRGPAYATNYLIDLDYAVIINVEASRAIRQAEVGAARTMIEG